MGAWVTQRQVPHGKAGNALGDNSWRLVSQRSLCSLQVPVLRVSLPQTVSAIDITLGMDLVDLVTF